jgi:hypothetical protein
VLDATIIGARAPGGIGDVARGPLARTAPSIRARLWRERLDRAQAAGAAPWSSELLLTRAAELTSPSTRSRLAGSIDALVGLAEHGAQPIAEIRIAHREVLARRDAFRALARRLRDPAPVGVAGLASLAELLWRDSSPVYDRHIGPGAVEEALRRCLALIEPAGLAACAATPDHDRRRRG